MPRKKKLKEKTPWYYVNLGQIIGVFWLTLISILFVNVITFGINNNSFLTQLPVVSGNAELVQAEVSETTVSTIQPIFTLTDRNLRIVTSQPILSDGTNRYLLVENTQTLNQYIYSISKDGKLNWKSLSIDPVSSNIIIASLGGVMFRSGENLKYVNNAGSIIIAPGCFDKTSPQSMIALDSTDRLIIQNLGTSEKEIVVCKDGTEIWSIARPSQVSASPLVLGTQTAVPNTQTSAFSEWKYRNKLTINNLGNPNTLTDYQISLIINTQELISASKMQSNCTDIRFSDTDGQTPLNYWVEGPCNSIATKIWVKVPIIKPVTTTDIYIYFGNPGAIDNSSASKTFVRIVDGLIGAWPLDELVGQTVNDLSGNGVNCNANGTSIVEGKYNKARYYSGNREQLWCGSSYQQFKSTKSNFTIELWVNPSTSENSNFYESYYSLQGDAHQFVFWPSQGDWQATAQAPYCWVTGSGGYTTGSGLIVSNNRITVYEHVACCLNATLTYPTTLMGWQHILVSFNNNQASLYLNGKLVRIGLKSIQVLFPPNIIGSDSWTNGSYFVGSIDEPRIYNRTLNSDEASELFSNYGYLTLAYPGSVLVRKITSPEPVIINNVSDSTINMSDGNVFFNSSVLGASAYNLDTIQPNVQTVTPIWSNAVRGLNTVTISGNNIYSTDLSNVLYSTNKETGATNWSLPIGTSQPLIAVGENVVYALHSKDANDGNEIYALDVQTGRLIWSYKLVDIIDPQSLILDEIGNLNFTEGKNYLIISPQGFKLEEYTLADETKLSGIGESINLIDQNSVYEFKPVINLITARRDNARIQFKVESSILKREINSHYNNQIQIILDNGHMIPFTWIGDVGDNSVWQGKLILSTNNKDQTEFTGTIETIIANYQGQNETHFSHLPERFVNQGITQNILLTFPF